MKDTTHAAIAIVAVLSFVVGAALLMTDVSTAAGKLDVVPRVAAPVATASRPTVEVMAPVVSTPFVEAAPVVFTDEAERGFRLRLLDDLNAAARTARDRKIARGETEPWNDGVPPKARPIDRVYSRTGKTLSGVVYAYHVVVRPEDDAEYARALWRWQDYLLENPR